MTPPEDFTRAAENLKHNSGKSIIDRDTFQISLEKYFEENKMTIAGTSANNKLWKEYRNLTGLPKGSIHSSHKGKDFKRDKDIRAKDTVKHVKDYHDASKQDLEGYDTPGKTTYRREPRHEFPRRGKQGKRIVFARQVFVTVKGKRHQRFIGKNGKYVRVSRK